MSVIGGGGGGGEANKIEANETRSEEQISKQTLERKG